MTSHAVAEASSHYQIADEVKKVPAGYKQTEVGVIPEDWEIITIGKALFAKSLVDQMDGNHGELYPKSHEFSSFGVPYIGATDFYSGKIDYKNCKYLPIRRAKRFKKGIAKNGDVLFAHNATVGPVAMVETDLDFIIISTTATYYRCNKEEINNIYLASYFRSEAFIKQFSSVMSQSTRNQVPIFTQRKFLLVLPPIHEQTAIANALSDVDALILEQEKLIAKKQAIKTATMQQLLTGRTRLSQFALRDDGSPKGTKPSELGEIPDDWRVGFVGDECDILTGFPFPSSKYSDSGIRLLRGSNVKRSRTDWSDEITQYWPELTSSITQYELKIGDIVISMDGSLVGRSFAELRESDLPALLLQRVARLRSETVSQCYLKEWICSKFFTEHCDSVKTVTAIPHISPQDIKSFKFLLPPLKGEQTAIATILSDMDEDIQALEQRLNKTRQIKQGMMQQLLTGKTRLVQPLDKGC